MAMHRYWGVRNTWGRKSPSLCLVPTTPHYSRRGGRVGAATNLLELDNVWMYQAAVIDDFPLDILGDLGKGQADMTRLACELFVGL